MGYEENVTSFLLSGIGSSFCYFYILPDNGKLKEHVYGPIACIRPKSQMLRAHSTGSFCNLFRLLGMIYKKYLLHWKIIRGDRSKDNIKYYVMVINNICLNRVRLKSNSIYMYSPNILFLDIFLLSCLCYYFLHLLFIKKGREKR